MLRRRSPHECVGGLADVFGKVAVVVVRIYLRIAVATEVRCEEVVGSEMETKKAKSQFRSRLWSFEYSQR